MNSKFPEDMGLIEILGKYFKDVVHEQPSISFDGVKLFTCIGYTIANLDVFNKSTGDSPIFIFHCTYQHINEQGLITYTEHGNIKTKEDIKTIFSVSDDDLEYLLHLWYVHVVPNETLMVPDFETNNFPREFIEVLVTKDYFNTERYTIDELLILSNTLNNIEIIPKEARDIFIF